VSEWYTEIDADGSHYMERGRLSYEEAMRLARRYFHCELLRAQRALDAIDAGRARVYHQKNLHAVKGRREVVE
jgi:hypothetical protein